MEDVRHILTCGGRQSERTMLTHRDERDGGREMEGEGARASVRDESETENLVPGPPLPSHLPSTVTRTFQQIPLLGYIFGVSITRKQEHVTMHLHRHIENYTRA